LSSANDLTALTLMARRAVFLDRDGTLNADRADYVKRLEELSWLPGIFEPLRRLNEAGFELIVVTNQAAVAKRLTDEEEIERIHQEMASELARNGIQVAGFYYCPHGERDGCECRKPRPGLLLRAAAQLDIDLSRSWIVGDRERDLAAGWAAGCRAILLTVDRPLSLAVSFILQCS
jgi:D-glycero-D-manno-heptose 1,7-bisphosphate phosphatase